MAATLMMSSSDQRRSQGTFTASWWRDFAQRAADIPPAQRPLQLMPAAEITTCLNQALAMHDGASGAHCIHELWMRRDLSVNIDQALECLWQSAAPSIPNWLPMRDIDWLPLVYEVAARFKVRARGSTNIYLVLLDYSADPHGIYVGMSRYTPERRFDQHKAGIRAAGSVLRRGLEVLTGPAMHLQYVKRADATRIESQLAQALADAGLFVQGGH